MRTLNIKKIKKIKKVNSYSFCYKINKGNLPSFFRHCDRLVSHVRLGKLLYILGTYYGVLHEIDTDPVIRQLDTGCWLRRQISLDRGWFSQQRKPATNVSCCCCSLDTNRILPVKTVNPKNDHSHVKTK